MSHEHFAGRLRELRADAGLTQVQLAERAGLSLRSVIGFEAGSKSPAWESVVAIATALGVPTDAFLAKPGKLPPRRRGRPKSI